MNIRSVRGFVCALVFALSSGILTGCFPAGGVREDVFQQALKMVDQGALLMKAQRLEEADAVFALAYEMAPLSAALDGRGCVAMIAGDLTKAEEFLIRAYQADRNYDQALVNLALVYELQGRIEEAKELYRAFLLQNPESAPARHNLAALEFDTIRQKGAVSASDHKAVRNELLKSAALSEHGVIADNILRLEELTLP